MATATNEIQKVKIDSLGYDFIPKQYIPEGQDEYYLRNLQNTNGIVYRQLTAYEIEVLVRNSNTCENWNKLLVSDTFNPELVKNCKFYGLVRIGKLEAFCLEFSDLKLPVGLYNSTIISSDFGDNVVINNVNYLSHYIIGNEVMITNVNELITTDYAKFGNGILKDGENEDVRIWMELCNENGGRKVIPFNGMRPGDAYLWSKYRGDYELLEKFKEFTEQHFDKKRGYYGKVGDRTVIKNCKIIKDVWIGSDAYLKGANKLKNLTINSGPEGKSQIGEGCEMVNGIMDYGCRAFYGVKAVRFVMASHSQLKYGARLINSFLGNNSTISCCEVLNSLIFPAHEQHHNNSFLCAALVMGQSNIAAGATLGSNHNSRSADGEIIAGRGFWPGLCVSLKHNSKFASYTILAKGDYPAELDIPIPFSLINNDVTNDRLVIMPGYWFMYNMYALERNSWKCVSRDRRKTKLQHFECDYLAPDTITEMTKSIVLFQKFTGKAWFEANAKGNAINNDAECIQKGMQLLESNDKIIEELEIIAEGFENTKRKVVLIKTLKCYHLFKELISYYFVNQLMNICEKENEKSLNEILGSIHLGQVFPEWINVGGQLIPKSAIENLIENVKNGKVKSWNEIHNFYQEQSKKYKYQKLEIALAAMHAGWGLESIGLTENYINTILEKALLTRKWMTEGIYESRAKDYVNVYRKMPYDSMEEMNEVIGKLEDNTFIQQQNAELENYKIRIENLKQHIKLNGITKRADKSVMNDV